MLGPGSQGGQQESEIFKLHQLSAFAVYGAVFGQKILPFDVGRNKVNTTCELTCTASNALGSDVSYPSIYTEKGAPIQMPLIFLG